MGKLPFEKVKRKILIRTEARTNKDYGEYPEKRSVENTISYGIVNLNKSEGPTSHQIGYYVKRVLKAKKVGHSGTLDPIVTGVLPIALGRATRIVQTLLTAGKEYICLMHLHKPVEKTKIKKVFLKFTGKIKQMPPVKSAIKRQLREREIYYLKILEIDKQDVLFKIGCEAGTYIRKICHDMGQSLGIGANMKQLIRTKAGPFTDETWHSLHDLKDAYEFWKEGDEKEIRKIVLPMEKAIEHLPKIWIFDTTVNALCHGADLYVRGISKLNDKIKENELTAILTLKNELVCLSISKMTSQVILKAEKGVATKTKKVFMEIDTYSKKD